MADENNKNNRRHSTFISALSWVFIALGGFASLIGLMQNIMLLFFFPKDQLTQALAEQPAAEQLPAFAKFMLGNIELFFLVFFAVALVTFISAIALLKR
jgi:hypothetical protein